MYCGFIKQSKRFSCKESNASFVGAMTVNFPSGGDKSSAKLAATNASTKVVYPSSKRVLGRPWKGAGRFFFDDFGFFFDGPGGGGGGGPFLLDFNVLGRSMVADVTAMPSKLPAAAAAAAAAAAKEKKRKEPKQSERVI